MWKTILITVAVAIMCFGFGGVFNPRVVKDVEHQYIEVPVEVIKEVEVPVEVEKIIYTNEVNNFESREDLINWLDSIRKDRQAAAQPDWNCIDYAWWLLERGRVDGYLIVYYPISADGYNAMFGMQHLPEGTWHRVCAVYIDGLTYLIEPCNFEVVP